MAKATVTTKSGVSVVIEGNPEEVALLVQHIEGGPASSTEERQHSLWKAKGTTQKSGISSLLDELIDDNFFGKPKGLGEVKSELETRGHYYELTSLSTPILRKVRAKRLRRIKKDGNWAYVN